MDRFSAAFRVPGHQLRLKKFPENPGKQMKASLGQEASFKKTT